MIHPENKWIGSWVVTDRWGLRVRFGGGSGISVDASAICSPDVVKYVPSIDLLVPELFRCTTQTITVCVKLERRKEESDRIMLNNLSPLFQSLSELNHRSQSSAPTEDSLPVT